MHFSTTTLYSVALIASTALLSTVTAIPARRPSPTPDPFCFAKCSDKGEYFCAENKKHQHAWFINPCQLGHYNCLNPKNTYTAVTNCACNGIPLPTP